MPTEAVKTLRSVAVTLSPDEITKIIKSYLEKEGFEVRNVDFKVSERTDERYSDSIGVLTFDGCTVACRIVTERKENGYS